VRRKGRSIQELARSIQELARSIQELERSKLELERSKLELERSNHGDHQNGLEDLFAHHKDRRRKGRKTLRSRKSVLGHSSRGGGQKNQLLR
jgi:hypothetical protein